jgi:hypothetical protein
MTHIMEDVSDDEHIVFDNKEKHKSTSQKEESKRKPHKVPVMTGRVYQHPRTPDIQECNIPTLHSTLYKYKGPSQREEVLLAIMDANLNKLNEGEEQLPNLCKKWIESAADILTGAPSHLPPLREVNHKIPLIDKNKRYNYHLPQCPDSLKTQLINKIQLYKEARWWEETNVSQATPMLCIYKKDGTKLRTIIDGHKRNDNTEKDVMPFPDQEQIRNDVARGKYRSKINMSNAYEQIRVEPGDMWKTTFTTIYGTFVSHMMQQGDCNAPATFQRLMTVIF